MKRINRLHFLVALLLASALWLFLLLRGKSDMFEGAVVTICLGTAAFLKVWKDSITTTCKKCGAQIESPLPPPPSQDFEIQTKDQK